MERNWNALEWSIYDMLSAAIDLRNSSFLQYERLYPSEYTI
jgi:hypothetical protein